MTDNKKIRFGITLRITLLAWMITLLTLSIFVIVTIPEQKRTFEENLESKADGVAVSIRDVAAGAVVAEDYGSLVDHCLQILKGDASIEYLVITKNTGESWIHERSGWSYRPLPGEWHPEKRVASSGLGVVPEFKRRVFYYSQPFDYSGIQWGWIHVGLSLEAYDRHVASVYRRTGILALLCVAASLFASAVYARLLVKPMLKLQAVVRQIARGDFSARATIQTGDEVELLADSFNAMAENLLQRDRILGSVQFASQQFLMASDWRSVAQGVLSRIGEPARIGRARVFETVTGPSGRLVAKMRCEHVAGSVESRWQEREFDWASVDLEPGKALLRQRRLFTAAAGKLSPATQALFGPQKVCALILIPIWIDEVWWGHMEFVDCERERIWTEAEVDSLRALADMLGAAIARQRAQDALLEAKATLERRVMERTRELEEQVTAKEKARAELADAQNELVVASRQAGMAEVATGVLHNVGNVLNSINVSTTLIRDRLRRSEVRTLARVRGLMEDHAGNLGEFLANDPKGKLVPRLIVQLSAGLDKEQAALREDLEQFARNVEHIKEIVAMQQSHARVYGVLEHVSMPQLMDDALQINEAALKNRAIAVVRHYAAAPLLTVDKHKVLQILVNVVRNAQQALEDSHAPEKRLMVDIGLSGDFNVRVTISDNGVGIPPENLTRIFSHGFTTRKGGHGFGLHSGAIAAKELGGTLFATSEGVGRGATFTLELPIGRSAESGNPGV